jgi:hypothetical protein
VLNIVLFILHKPKIVNFAVDFLLCDKTFLSGACGRPTRPAGRFGFAPTQKLVIANAVAKLAKKNDPKPRFFLASIVALLKQLA